MTPAFAKATAWHGRLLLLSLLCASAAWAHSTIILNWVETTTTIDYETFTTNTVSTVCFSVADKFGARFTDAVRLPTPYSAADVSNAVATGSARLARAAKVTEWTPTEAVLP